ncbi:sodium/potassium/calcium exchanger 4-like isoform X1 [Tachysurus fulvidraco]|uniref:sodium/potassium/calcium exchanger 4-like isoform X1 n=1 Tax=Tachysurus fulvidraco TaxID=1234273 RepID=UPI001FEFCE32|nr:sodium/potassium/calcium exchanger 4-like isoform X1 [Tachysurus fulvidraco]
MAKLLWCRWRLLQRAAGVLGNVGVLTQGLYMLLALHTVCGDLMTSLKKLCKMCNLSEDVAGATLMAAGTSAPEIFISTISEFFTQADVGVKTIIGSGLFNILFITGLCGIAAGHVLLLKRWAVIRDSVTYMLSVVALIGITHDGKIIWWESLLLVVMYVGYILITIFNSHIQTFFGIEPSSGHERENDNDIQLRGVEEESNTGDADLSTDDPGEGTIKDHSKESTDNGEPTSPFSIPTMAITRLCRTAPSMSKTPGTSGTIQTCGGTGESRNRVDTSPSPVDWSTMCKRFLGFFTFMMVMFGLGEVFPAYRPVAPKQYPYNNLYLEHGGDPEKQTEPAKHYEI